MKIRTKKEGTPIEELMRWRRGKVTLKCGREFYPAYRKIQLGVVYFQIKVNDVWTSISPDSVQFWMRAEWICQPHQEFDPQTLE